jgi:hypothetical protein
MVVVSNREVRGTHHRTHDFWKGSVADQEAAVNEIFTHPTGGGCLS